MSLILDGTNGLSDVDGSASTPAIRGTDTNTGIFFPAADTIAFAEGGAESMRLNSSGNLGLGTTSPATRLHVSGGTRVADSTNSANYITIASGNEAPYGGNSVVAQTNSLTMGSVSSNPVAFLTNATERMRIDSNGQVFVKPSTGGSYIAGDSGFYSDGGFGNSLLLGNTYGSGKGFVTFYNNTTSIGGINAATASTVVYLTSSDYRLKENIAPMTGALDKVQALKPCTYKWKLDGTDGQGFIAHELQAVVPDCVFGEKDAVNEDGSIKPQGIDTSFLVATLTAAIQEQQTIITDLKSRIEALEAK